MTTCPHCGKSFTPYPLPASGKRDTSQAVAAKHKLPLTGLRRRVNAALLNAGEQGLTASECTLLFRPDGILEKSIRPRLTELVHMGLAYRSTERRLSPLRKNDHYEIVYKTVKGETS